MCIICYSNILVELLVGKSHWGQIIFKLVNSNGISVTENLTGRDFSVTFSVQSLKLKI